MKKILALLMVFILGVPLCACGGNNGPMSKIVGEWNIISLSIEPQYRFVTARDDTVNQIAEAFPETNTTVEFTYKKYGDGYKMISSSNVTSYSLMSGQKISVGTAVGEYELSRNELVIEFKDIATITLEKE